MTSRNLFDFFAVLAVNNALKRQDRKKPPGMQRKLPLRKKCTSIKKDFWSYGNFLCGRVISDTLIKTIHPDAPKCILKTQKDHSFWFKCWGIIFNGLQASLFVLKHRSCINRYRLKKEKSAYTRHGWAKRCGSYDRTPNRMKANHR